MAIVTHRLYTPNFYSIILLICIRTFLAVTYQIMLIATAALHLKPSNIIFSIVLFTPKLETTAFRPEQYLTLSILPHGDPNLPLAVNSTIVLTVHDFVIR